MKKNILVGTAIVSVVVLSSSVVFALDSNSKKSITNDFRPAEITLGVVEDTTGTEPVTQKDYVFTTDDDGNLGVEKSVKILNVDATNPTSADAFIRATIVPMWVATNSVDEDTTQNFVVGAMGGIIDGKDNEQVEVTYVTDNDHEYLNIGSFGNLTDVTIENNQFTMGDVTFTLVDGWEQNWIFNPKDGYFYYRYVVPAGGMTAQLLQSVSMEDSKLYRYEDNPITLRVDILADSVQALGGAINDVWADVGVERVEETTEREGDTTTCIYGYYLETAKDDTKSDD